MARTNPCDLPGRQFLFCQNYIKRGFCDAGRAYGEVYKCKTRTSADACASRLLRNARVRCYLAEIQQQATENTQITLDRVLRELGKIAFSDMRNYAKWGPEGVRLEPSEHIEPDAAAAVAEVSETITQHGGSIRFKLHDKVSALREIGRQLGMFADRVEHTAREGKPIGSKVSNVERLLQKIDRVAARQAQHREN